MNAFRDADALVSRDADLAHAFAHGIDRGRRHASKERLHAAPEAEVVVDLLHGVLIGKTVKAFQRADACRYRIRRGDGSGNLRLELLRMGTRDGQRGDERGDDEFGGCVVFMMSLCVCVAFIACV